MAYYKSCSELPLKVFFQVAESGDLQLLVIDGKEDIVLLTDAWEEILIEYSKLDKNMALTNHMEQREELFKQAALYCEIKAMLLYLIGAYKQEFIDRLNELGYRIDKDNMIESIKRNDQKSNHISTRMKMVQNEMKEVTEGKKSSFDSVMAWLASELNFEPKEDMTVLRYIEYKNIIHERNKSARLNKRSSV